MNPKVSKQGCAWYLLGKPNHSLFFFCTILMYGLAKKIIFIFLQSLAYFPFAIANALTARLDDGFAPRHLLLSFLL
jgi:hypothetical protein